MWIINEDLRDGLTTEGVGPAFGCELADQALGIGSDPEEAVL
jgi:hypothetical protein